MDHPNNERDDITFTSLSELTVEARTVVRQMRARGARRQDASLFVCRRLLYEAGEVPNARLVREISEWGSISDVQEDVRVFFRSLRKSVSAILPESGLPDELQETFARSLAELYAQACRAADGRLRDQHDALALEKDAWQTEETALKTRLAESEQNRRALEEQTRAQAAHVAQLESDAKVRQAAISEFAAKNEQLQGDLTQALREIAVARETLIEQTAVHARALAEAEDRAEARRAPLLLEIDSLRQARKAIEQTLQNAHAELETSRTELSELRSRLPLTERMLEERSTSLEAVKAQLEERGSRVHELQDALRQANEREAAALKREASARADLSSIVSRSTDAAAKPADEASATSGRRRQNAGSTSKKSS